MLLLIDNLDSFTYNISSAFESLGHEVLVRRYDALTIEECLQLKPQAVIIGPGPGHADKSALSKELIVSGLPILGICMGHQLIGTLFGAKLELMEKPEHGKRSLVHHKGAPLFEGIPSPFWVMRYHSWTLREVREPLEAIAFAGDEVMAVRHKTRPIVGVQFHPDSFGTEYGFQIFSNFMKILAAAFGVVTV